LFHGGIWRGIKQSSFRGNLISYVFLKTNQELNAHKGGIGNANRNMGRLGGFNAKDWEVFKVWQFKTGREAFGVEKLKFKIIRKDLNIPIYLSCKQMKSMDGNMEMMGADSISLLEFEKVI
jgi:hypothetical protein